MPQNGLPQHLERSESDRQVIQRVASKLNYPVEDIRQMNKLAEVILDQLLVSRTYEDLILRNFAGPGEWQKWNRMRTGHIANVNIQQTNNINYLVHEKLDQGLGAQYK